MKKLFFLLILTFSLTASVFVYYTNQDSDSNGAPPYNVGGNSLEINLNNISSFVDWERPDGPARVALQVGHWKTDEAPDEQEGLRGNHGASGGGKAEWEVNMEIANRTAEILKEEGIFVEILPTTIPPKYYSDAFVSIHADGNNDPNKSGFKAATSWRDVSGNADNLLKNVESSYGDKTQLEIDPNVTRNMRGYYAFRWWRFEHAIHPMTPAIILETGFLSSPNDRLIIVDQPQLAAEGIAKGVIKFLEDENLIES